VLRQEAVMIEQTLESIVEISSVMDQQFVLDLMGGSDGVGARYVDFNFKARRLSLL
jgi:hypothetical protein